MNLRKAFDRVVEIAKRASTADDGWTQLVEYLHGSVRAPTKTSFASVPIRRDVTQVRTILKRLLQEEPPPPSIDAFWFGLFDTVDDDDCEAIGYYVAGIAGFDPDDGDTLCDPAWWPDGRYIESLALNAVKTDELKARSGRRTHDANVLAYAGQLGTALIVSKFASVGLFGDGRRVVGFDSGDFAVLD